ncbi:SnoaL-like domain-containing protein [Nonomuraea sp. NN258]|uniref:nuclear transport factor 2 family protein n=1 Tax=Nonomuraea antri TaxID=2730852 RepID=UPI00156A0EF5|nr:nuclear transport factor 2 family protein [Nonomuraea antri]NRQ34583.1 SnoaL-like domain-containing protein [Nonomuraea antri]
MKVANLAVAVMALAVTAGACAQATPSPIATSGSTAPAVPTSGRTEDVVDAFVRAANSGDAAALRKLFAPDARFDRAGTVFTGAAIVDDFLKPDVTDAGGRYRETSRRVEGERLTVAFTFDTGHGGQELFTYSFLVRGGRISDVVGRYL